MHHPAPEQPIGVRPATLADVPAVACIHVRSWQRAYRGQIPDAVLDALDVEQRASLWRTALATPSHVLLLAVREGCVIGFCALASSRDAGAESGTAEVTAIYVDPDNYRMRAGRALMAAAFAEARRRRDRALTLWVLDANEGARRFYESCGLRADGASKVVDRPGYSLREVRYRIELGAAARG